MPQIQKILFPTSCSENSKKAFAYTLAMAKYFGCSVDVLYVCKPNVDLLVPSVMRYNLLQEEKHNAEKKLEQWIKEFEVHNLEIHQEVEMGYAKEMIAIYANKRQDIDLIVMGTNDAYSLRKIIWGTIVSETIESANAPVLVVPKGIVFQDIKNIAYVTPPSEHWRSVYPQVEGLATDFSAQLYITHLPQAKYEVRAGEEHRVLEDYASALHSFVYNTNLQLLVTIEAVRSTLTRIFKYSKAQKMALKATIPLLVLKKK